jgi:hypothetical protein
MKTDSSYKSYIDQLPDSYFINQIPNILSSKKGGSLVYKY